MTYVDTEGKFGALGHGISDTDTGELLDIEDGELYQAQIMSIVKGVKAHRGNSPATLNTRRTGNRHYRKEYGNRNIRQSGAAGKAVLKRDGNRL